MMVRKLVAVLCLLFLASGFVWGAVTYKESPLLAAKVRAGEIPSVDKRLPEKPKVMEMIEGVGKYGGDLHVFATADIPNQDLQEFRYGFPLFRVPRAGIGIEPNIAENYSVNKQEKSMTIFLRKGLKWSDGQPFTAEDIRFQFVDMHLKGPAFGGKVTTWGGIDVTGVQVIDQYTVKLLKTNPLGILPIQLSDWYGSQTTAFQPAHYLKKWHIDFNPDAEKIAKEEGFDNWWTCFQSHYWWWPIKDVKEPRMEPWVLKEFSTSGRIFERNPYYFAVDPAGNQLPYTDRLVVQNVDNEVYQLKVSGGAADIAYTNTTLANLSLYKSNEKAGDYRTILYTGTMSSAFTLDYVLTVKDPVLNALANNVKFRQAQSVAINRDEINKIVCNGLGKPGNTSPLPSATFYKQGWREYFAQYDPALANKLLDEIGLTRKDASGFRIGSDGKVISIVIEYATGIGDRLTPAFELIKEYWDSVGLKTTLSMMDIGLIGQRRTNGDTFLFGHQLAWYPSSSEREAFLNLWVWSDEGVQGPVWDTWLSQKRTAAQEVAGAGKALPDNWRWLPTPKDATLAGVKPPDYWLKQADLEDLWLQTEPGTREYVDLGRQVFDFYVTSLIKLGTVGEVPSVLIAKNKLGNVITPNWVKSYDPSQPLFTMQWVDQLYWK